MSLNLYQLINNNSEWQILAQIYVNYTFENYMQLSSFRYRNTYFGVVAFDQPDVNNILAIQHESFEMPLIYNCVEEPVNLKKLPVQIVELFLDDIDRRMFDGRKTR